MLRPRHSHRRRHRLTLRIAGALWALAWAVGEPAARGQEATASEPPRDLPARLEEIDQRLAALEESLDQGAEAPAVDGESGREELLRREVRLLERLRLVLLERQQADLRRTELEDERRRLEAESGQDPQAFLGHAPPFSIAELDEVLDRRDALERSRVTLEETIADQAQALAEAQDGVRQREREEAAARQALADAEAALVAVRRWELRLQELATQLEREEAGFLELQLANDRLDLTVSSERERRLEEAAAWLRPRIAASEEDLRQARERFAAEKAELQSLVDDASREADRAAARWSQVQRQLAASAAPDAALAERAEGRRAALTLARQRRVLAEDRQRRLAAQQEAWELRWRLLGGEIKKLGDLEAARETLLEISGDLGREQRRRQSQLLEVRASLIDLGRRLDELAPGDPAAADLREQRQAARELAELYQDDIELLARALSRVERPLAQVDLGLARVGLGERLTGWWQTLVGVRDYPLLTVDGSSITVGKVVAALVLIFAGLWLSRRLAALFARRVLGRFGLAEGAVAAIRTLTFYLLLLAFFVWALKLVEIPLTVFAFLGGAVAIGVGFGSQAIANNFMSGLILMVERPVKVGDLIDLEGTYGRVEHIGARSTQIRSGDNTHVIVPNSTLLETRVLNWTLSDNVIRTRMDVGVAYGSDVVAVKANLERALEESRRVLAKPAPEVLFVEFGDNALLFRALFWTEVLQPMDQQRAQSEVRFRVDELFRDAGITIAFPQRDVHLDTLSPLEIRLRDDAPPSAGGEP